MNTRPPKNNGYYEDQISRITPKGHEHSIGVDAVLRNLNGTCPLNAVKILHSFIT